MWDKLNDLNSKFKTIKLAKKEAKDVSYYIIHCGNFFILFNILVVTNILIR